MSTSASSSTSTPPSANAGPSGQNPHPLLENNDEKNSVVIKVGMVGDSQIGKTSLMVKYVEGSFDEDYIQTLGVNFMEKTISVRRTTITFSIWDLGGQREFVNMLPLVCNDAVAILFMFDLSRKSTLNSVKEWYRQARGFNKTAIPFLIGTKFDQFATFPRDEQEEITKQAKRFARAMHASLIFCSTSASINVQKIFKIVLAKAFDLKCVIPEIEGVGEPVLIYVDDGLSLVEGVEAMHSAKVGPRERDWDRLLACGNGTLKPDVLLYHVLGLRYCTEDIIFKKVRYSDDRFYGRRTSEGIRSILPLHILSTSPLWPSLVSIFIPLSLTPLIDIIRVSILPPLSLRSSSVLSFSFCCILISVYHSHSTRRCTIINHPRTFPSVRSYP